MAERPEWRDPFADYIEWTENRYNPGHYLGGTLPPHLRKSSLGPRGRRLSGILLGILAVLSLASAVASAGLLSGTPGWESLLAVPMVVLLAAAAWRMYRSGTRPAGERDGQHE